MTFSLEHALEFIAEDECVEVTPKAVRLRKVAPGPGDPGAVAEPGPRRTASRREAGLRIDEKGTDAW